MRTPQRSFLVVLCLAIPIGPLLAARPVLDEAALAHRIDHHIEARLAERRVPPAALTDDAAFIRRVFLDLAGRIPSILEVRDFLDDDRPNKRRLWVDQLLRGIRRSDQGETYADHFAAVWRSWLMPPPDPEQPTFGFDYQAWLRQQLRENVPYDRMVRESLVGIAPSFLQARGNTPEALAAATARLFLGVKLECAQCHDDRSGGNWSREQFWELAAFFTRLSGQPARGTEPEITIPGLKRTVKARFPTGAKPNFSREATPQVTLAGWVTAPDNPWFARATVNRLWAYLLGTGLVEPVDEFGAHNPPSHPELLDELAAQFVAHRYDLKYLLRAIVLSKTYQRQSLTSHPGQDDPRLFARAAVRGLSAEQIFDSLAEVAEYRSSGLETPPGYGGQRSPRQEFIDRFTSRERRVESHTSILQALHLMNGSFVSRATSPDQNRTLATIADAAKIDTARRLETLYLVVLSRKPTPAEVKRLGPYIERGGPSGSRRKALADVLWALLNSSEFLLNH
jgi:Protein of unknown function (DUF1553)/Protein of unknown function (DUF1549)